MKNKYEGPPQFKRHALALCDVIRRIMKLSENVEVGIYAWTYKGVGIRIAEIGLWEPSPGGHGGAGSSWMRVDEGASALILAAEDYILYSYLKEDQFIEEAIEKLERVVKE